MKRWLATVATFAAFGAAGLAIALWPEPGERAAQTARAVPALAEGSFDSIEVFAKGTLTTVRREGDGQAARFVVAAGAARWPADPIGARAAFTALERLDWVARTTARQARHAELQVDDARGVRVRVWQGSRVVVELVVGKVDAGGTFVRPADGDQVWRVGGELRDTFDKSATEWRNRAVTRFDQDQARELAVTARDGAQIVLRRKPDELVSVHASVPGFGGLSHARWEVREASVRIDKLDEIVPREVVATLASLDASSFADDLPPSAAGLDPAVLTVRVALGDGQGDRDDPRARAVTIAIGDDAGADETFVKVVGAPQIYRVKRFNVERVNRRPIQFRDKTLCNISDQDVVAFGVVRGGESYAVERRAEGWKATQPSGMVVDPEKVAPLASVFRGWNAPAIAENAPARGDGAPRMVISGRSKDKTCTISVGDEAPNAAGYFVRTATSSDTYVVPKWMVDRIAVPLDDLRKS